LHHKWKSLQFGHNDQSSVSKVTSQWWHLFVSLQTVNSSTQKEQFATAPERLAGSFVGQHEKAAVWLVFFFHHFCKRRQNEKKAKQDRNNRKAIFFFFLAHAGPGRPK